jgi:hypothetical protein
MTNNLIAAAYTKCQWIGPEQEYPNFRMLCACKPLLGRAYCEEHHARVYQKGTALAKRKKDIRTANSVWDIESAFNEAVEELVNEGEL